MVFGSMVAATDPVAVVALLEELVSCFGSFPSHVWLLFVCVSRGLDRKPVVSRSRFSPGICESELSSFLFCVFEVSASLRVSQTGLVVWFL